MLNTNQLSTQLNHFRNVLLLALHTELYTELNTEIVFRVYFRGCFLSWSAWWRKKIGLSFFIVSVSTLILFRRDLKVKVEPKQMAPWESSSPTRSHEGTGSLWSLVGSVMFFGSIVKGWRFLYRFRAVKRRLAASGQSRPSASAETTVLIRLSDPPKVALTETSWGWHPASASSCSTLEVTANSLSVHARFSASGQAGRDKVFFSPSDKNDPIMGFREFTESRHHDVRRPKCGR